MDVVTPPIFVFFQMGLLVLVLLAGFWGPSGRLQFCILRNNHRMLGRLGSRSRHDEEIRIIVIDMLYDQIGRVRGPFVYAVA